MSFYVPEKFRVRKGPYATDENDGNNGLFLLAINRPGHAAIVLRVIASDGADWDHVSVSTPDRCPTWFEMAAVKDMFWSPSDCVMQLHPPADDYVNHHPYCLHLWRPQSASIPRPPSILVGPKA